MLGHRCNCVSEQYRLSDHRNQLLLYVRSKNTFCWSISYIYVYHTYHVSWATDDGWEDSSWGVIATEASLHHSGSIVDHEGSYLFLRIRHDCRLLVSVCERTWVILVSSGEKSRTQRELLEIYTLPDGLKLFPPVTFSRKMFCGRPCLAVTLLTLAVGVFDNDRRRVKLSSGTHTSGW